MAKLSFKEILIYLVLGLCMFCGILPSLAQTFGAGLAPAPGVLVAKSALAQKKPGPNLETSLVDIKAVDQPTLISTDGKLKVGAVERYGQGIIIDSSGIIATNRHITGNALHIYVMLAGGKVYEAVLLRNAQADLSLIKINTSLPLRAISLADPSEIQIGSHVFAITNAGFNPQRVRDGEIIKIYKGVSSNTIELLEMNITLKPGDSGGPVLNQEGSLLGLIMGKQISDPTKSFAITSGRIEQEYLNYRNSILN